MRALADRHVMICQLSDVDLARTVNSPLGVVANFLEVRYPARHAANGKNDCEHFGGNTNSMHNYPTVKVYVWIELPFDEVSVRKRRLF